ncbi:hypothetical protein Tco_0816927, partial [Tanacetum coccineum]
MKLTPISIGSMRVLEWEEIIKLHQEKKIEFNQWMSKVFNDERSALVNEGCEGFAAALAVLITGASQSRQHESRKSPTVEVFDVDSGGISIITMNTKEYHSEVLENITRIMRRTLTQ